MTDPPTTLDLSGALRALRRRADLSQRDLAARSGVPSGTISGVESGTSPNPTLRTVERLVAATGARLAIVDIDGSEPTRLELDHLRDGAARRFPAHLDPHPATVWRGIYRIDRIAFIRNRRRRDSLRREYAGEERERAGFSIRRLGPADAAVLRAIRAAGPELDLTGRDGGATPPLSDPEALSYLRDPSLRHWVAEQWFSGQVLGHLVAHLHRRDIGPPTMVVTELGIRTEQRAEGLVGIGLTAAMDDEAVLLGAGEVIAITGEPVVARHLRGLGYRRRPRRPPVLTLAGSGPIG